MILSNQIALVCRPKKQSEHLLDLLASYGAQPILFPPLGILPKLDKLSKLNALFLNADWVFFVSPSAIDVACPHLNFKNFSGSLFCVGSPSAEKLRKISERNVYCPEQNQNDSTALLQLPIFEHAFGKKVLIIRGEGGRSELIQTLNSKGAQVFVQEVYQRIKIPLNWDLFDELNQTGRLTSIFITSGEIADTLFRSAPQAALDTLKQLLYIVPHERIRERLQRLGASHIIVSEAGDENMVNCLIGVIKSL